MGKGEIVTKLLKDYYTFLPHSMPCRNGQRNAQEGIYKLSIQGWYDGFSFYAIRSFVLQY